MEKIKLNQEIENGNREVKVFIAEGGSSEELEEKVNELLKWESNIKELKKDENNTTIMTVNLLNIKYNVCMVDDKNHPDRELGNSLRELHTAMIILEFIYEI